MLFLLYENGLSLYFPCCVLYGMDFSFSNLAFINQFQASNLKEGSCSIRTGVTGEEVKQRAVQSAGMFATAKRIYTSFSSI